MLRGAFLLAFTHFVPSSFPRSDAFSDCHPLSTSETIFKNVTNGFACIFRPVSYLTALEKEGEFGLRTIENNVSLDGNDQQRNTAPGKSVFSFVLLNINTYERGKGINDKLE